MSYMVLLRGIKGKVNMEWKNVKDERPLKKGKYLLKQTKIRTVYWNSRDFTREETVFFEPDDENAIEIYEWKSISVNLDVY